jgi:hypothetical protein
MALLDALNNIARGADNAITGFNTDVVGSALDGLYDNTIGELTGTRDAWSAEDIAPWAQAAESMALSFIPVAGVPLSLAFNAANNANELLDGDEGALTDTALDAAFSFVPGAGRFIRNLAYTDKSIDDAARAVLGMKHGKAAPLTLEPPEFIQDKGYDWAHALTGLDDQTTRKAAIDNINNFTSEFDAPLIRGTTQGAHNPEQYFWSNSPAIANLFSHPDDVLLRVQPKTPIMSGANFDHMVSGDLGFAKEYYNAKEWIPDLFSTQRVPQRMSAVEAHPVLSRIKAKVHPQEPDASLKENLNMLRSEQNWNRFLGRYKNPEMTIVDGHFGGPLNA